MPSTQLLFRDETAPSIGPSSEVTLDRFVGDLSGSATSVAVNLSKGALRVVSGASDPRRYRGQDPARRHRPARHLIDVRYVDGKVYVILTEGATDACVQGEALRIGDEARRRRGDRAGRHHRRAEGAGRAHLPESRPGRPGRCSATASRTTARATRWLPAYGPAAFSGDRHSPPSGGEAASPFARTDHPSDWTCSSPA